jgi:hypothetical protein
MNSIQACFLLGLFLGAIMAGFVVYEVEELAKLEIKNAQDKALITAQNKVIDKEREGQAITQKVSQDYEKKIAAINAPSKRLQSSSSGCVSKVSVPTAGAYAACRIRLSALQSWIKQETTVYNK